MTMPATTAPEGDVMESVIAKGDLSKLTPDERVRYYNATCKSLGLNPLTNPFQYITLNGRLTLYATRTATDQLRKLNGINIEIVSRTIADDILTVHVKARTPDGRVDEDYGAVAFPAMLKGEARANAELKAVTKAKRRATLSICGLGWLDETDIDDIPAAPKRTPPKAAPNVMLQPLPPHDAETGEIEPADDVDSELVAAHMARCEAAAAKGWRALKDEWDTTPEAVADVLRDAHLGRWKEMAKAAEAPA